MIKNYIKIAWRNFKRDASYSLINIIGLAIALSAFIIIGLFIYDELSYDQYHDDADQIFRIYRSSEQDGTTYKSLATANLLAPTLKREFSGIEETTRISTRIAGSLVESDSQKRYEDELLMADPSLFSMFNFPFIQGNPQTALNRAFTVVITESTAQRYFGDVNPMGKTISITSMWGKEAYEVTGVVKDVPPNTHFSFQLVTSMETLRTIVPDPEDSFESWNHVGSYTYLKLQDGVAANDVEARFQAAQKTEQLPKGFYLQPVTDIHLYSNFDREIQLNSDIRYVYIFGSVALLILLLASINYANLAMAKSTERAMEVGIHKTLGVSRLQVVCRFLTESTMLCLIAVLLAICLTEMLLPLFNNLIGKELSLLYAPFPFLLILLLFAGSFSLFNGLYPALAFSKYRPSKILSEDTSGRKKSYLRNGLIVFQFTAAVILIVVTFVINDQLDYVNNKRLGLNEEQVINVQAGDGLASKFSVFRDWLVRYPSIKDLTFTGNPLPSATVMEMCLYPSDHKPSNSNTLVIGPNFLSTLQIPLLKGRSIDSLSISRENDFFPVLINETAMKEFGWEEEPIGQTLECFSPTPTVVGVVGDFHYESLKNEIEPLVMMGSISDPRNVLVRVHTDSIRSTLDRIEHVWDEVGPGTPFTYSFMDENYQQLYNAEDKMAALFEYFTLLAIAIGCLGLFGLSAFTAQRRTKEIGIRKVLGASISNIVLLLSKDFLKLIGISLIIAIPASLVLANRWLQDFAYKIEIGPGVFLLAGGVALLIALATVSWQSIRAAVANPVDSLRSE